MTNRRWFALPLATVVLLGASISAQASKTVTLQSPQARAVQSVAASALDRARRLESNVKKLRSMTPQAREGHIASVAEQARQVAREMQALERKTVRTAMPQADAITLNTRYFDVLKGVLDRTELNVRRLAIEAWGRIAGTANIPPPGCSGKVDWKSCDGSGCYACCEGKPSAYASWCLGLCTLKVSQCLRTKAGMNIRG